MTRLRFFNIVHEVPFWAIALIMIVFVLISGHFAGRSNGVEVWPVTYLMVAVVSGQSGLFLVIIGALYAGELMWRGRGGNVRPHFGPFSFVRLGGFVGQVLLLAPVGVGAGLHG